jgi:hypothetical protein
MISSSTSSLSFIIMNEMTALADCRNCHCCPVVIAVAASTRPNTGKRRERLPSTGVLKFMTSLAPFYLRISERLRIPTLLTISYLVLFRIRKLIF